MIGAIWPQTLSLFRPRLEALHASRAFGSSIGRRTNQDGSALALGGAGVQTEAKVF
jgi:hypothetical protein